MLIFVLCVLAFIDRSEATTQANSAQRSEVKKGARLVEALFIFNDLIRYKKGSGYSPHVR